MPSAEPPTSLPPIARYAAVGAVATAVHYLLLVAAVRCLGWPAFVGSGLGAVVGAQVAFFGNRRYTFDHAGRWAKAWPRFQATALAGAAFGMAVVAVGVAAGVDYLAAQVVATGLGLLLTFSINRLWTFR